MATGRCAISALTSRYALPDCKDIDTLEELERRVAI